MSRPYAVLVLSEDEARAQALSADLTAVGFHVLGACDCHTLVRDAVRLAPVGVVAWIERLDEPALRSLNQLRDTQALPVLLFTSDGDVERLSLALEAGVHGCVVQNYDRSRLRVEWQLARLRFDREGTLRRTLDELRQRFEERKLVDRAKGLLMRATRMSEDEAFRALRRASMQGNRRVGQVSLQLIDAARHGEAVNRAGQLRMLSQRLVKLYALAGAGIEPDDSLERLAQSARRIDDNLAFLGRSLSAPSFGDLLSAVQGTWSQLRPSIETEPRLATLADIDALAQELLEQAERLTAVLEQASAAATLHVINVAGRQRMLSQRLAKQVLLAHLLPGSAGQGALADAVATQKAFEEAQAYLEGLPLADGELRAALASAHQSWVTLLDGAHQAGATQGRVAVARASEILLERLDQLTERYEHSLDRLLV
ncbi:type IV pili methyl-accepting chemotaxis transducer N-terminal domain-containing protein [Caldimonas caldifontis]|uniref:Response regulator receiver protein n=1 Tax=Caldimonas caldifontis TaxID=1452508 RepID=A0A2S5SW80_9BURK|nr:type IV pili methyl-accepting chemotaxis transducer N-terminal domain-containing protein [Caldimonas caldifontis]PPE67015.1 response regulator receiver protein [Caldimonas caldifontis]